MVAFHRDTIHLHVKWYTSYSQTVQLSRSRVDKLVVTGSDCKRCGMQVGGVQCRVNVD
jgi:hypothetical protein